MSLNIITRKQWGMRQNGNFATHTPEEIVFHHVGSGEQGNLWIYDRHGSEYCLKSVESFHVDTRKYFAIGYHYIVFPDAVYEGRPIENVGAHVLNQNRGKIGVLVYGNFNYEQPTHTQKEFIRLLVEDIRSRAIRTRDKQLLTHGELANTVCPGKYLQLYIDELNKSKPQVNREDEKLELILEKFKSLENQFNKFKNLINGLR